MRKAARRIAVFFCFALSLSVLSHVAEAQTFTVLHNFTGGPDGANPWGQLAIDQAGDLYIGTQFGGNDTNSGAADKLKRVAGGWVLQPLYAFNGYNGDPSRPVGPKVVLSSNDALFGSTTFYQNAGTVFQLRPSATPPATPLASWNQSVLYTFGDGADGGQPQAPPIVDPAGNLYGTAFCCGAYGGTVYELVHTGQSYTEMTLYSFQGGNDGVGPVGLIADSTFTHLYCVTTYGGPMDAGTVFELTNTGSGWTETVLYSFQGAEDGWYPQVGLAMDSAGNLYGASSGAYPNGPGAVFKLIPSGGGYTFSILYNGPFGCFNYCWMAGPIGGYLTLDSDGNIYGTTSAAGANERGSVFELSPSGGGYTYTDLHDFTGGSDGAFPLGGITRDAAGNLYGTTDIGGVNDDGVIFEINPSQSPK